MARRRTPRRKSVPGLVRFEEPKSSTGRTGPDAALFQLAARLRVAEQAHDEAMSELALAEQRFAAMSEEEKRAHRRPAWFIAAQEREASTGDALEVIYGQIAQTPAQTKTGLAIKLQLASLLYCGNVNEAGDDEDADMVSQLIHSLIADVTER